MNSVEHVGHTEVSCDGGGGSLGHPKVYLEMGDKAEVACPYCGKKFILKPVSSVSSH